MKSSRVLQIAILVLGIATLTANLRASSQQGALDGQVLHILVGKSVIVNVEAPITRVLSSNPGVIGTLATSPRQVVVEGKAAGSSSLIVWDDAGRSQMLGLRGAVSEGSSSSEAGMGGRWKAGMSSRDVWFRYCSCTRLRRRKKLARRLGR